MPSPRPIRLSALAVAALALALVPGMTAHAATTIDGPIDLGTAGSFSVLGSSTVTNTGTSVLDGDLGLSPGTSITGFPPGIVNGTTYQTDATAAQAQTDLDTAYGVGAGLTPTTTGLGDLAGQSPVPGVYSGGELALTGALELAGTADSVWVFQAASTLTIGSGARITMGGDASACNVFWVVGSSATIGTGADFIGTVMAAESITATTGASVEGRLLARNGAVTLDTNLIDVPTGCNPPGEVTTSPTITSSTPPAGQVGTPYAHTVTASGAPAPTYAVSSGSLPAGLSLDSTTGALSGQPTTPGSYTFTVNASNGTAPDATATYTVTIGVAVVPAPAPGETPADEADGTAGSILPVTGVEYGGTVTLAATLLMLLGAASVLISRRRRTALL